MKVKEYWPSFRTALKMKRLDVADLIRPAGDTVPVIVTLTSIPSRLRTLHLAIRSVLNQSWKPEKVVLWLHQDLRDQLPESLKVLQGGLFEIRYVDLTCSHRKLIHAVEAFPDKVLVTCDDDLIYGHTWLERLYRSHQGNPADIIAHECRRIKHDSETGDPLPYKQWSVVRERNVSGLDLISIGYGGVLYPSGVLDDRLTDVELFLKLTPRADDLWFKAMALLAGTMVRRSFDPGTKPLPIIGSQKDSLLKTNVREDGNRQQWSALCDYFGITLLLDNL